MDAAVRRDTDEVNLEKSALESCGVLGSPRTEFLPPCRGAGGGRQHPPSPSMMNGMWPPALQRCTHQTRQFKMLSSVIRVSSMRSLRRRRALGRALIPA
ncbi:hypothetical protein GHT09_015373 [Marmota monax]|uniref:Uncharacterized protein n=1 Tax=Marmota monax TaxID=9995 RepID=A0A834PKA9_MARMO|nr:hypothetical protein GHT09_015373 [Marmota monax]